MAETENEISKIKFVKRYLGLPEDATLAEAHNDV